MFTESAARRSGDTSSKRQNGSPRPDRRPQIVVRPKGPFDLLLSLEAAASFFPVTEPPPTVLRTAVETDGQATIIEIRQSSQIPTRLSASSTPGLDANRLRSFVKWLTSWDLDLRPFYAVAMPHPVLGPVATSLVGLKPLRPATFFEMAVIAITEQQLSLAAAFHIRSRLVRRFGILVGDLWVFPKPETLAMASLGDLTGCGLSHRKAEYIRDLATAARDGHLDFDALKRRNDQRIAEVLSATRGFGEWTIQYILARGFGRPDCLPSGDVGLRRVAGQYFGEGRRLTPAELERALRPFQPFRGLAAFYLAVHWRLRRRKTNVA